VICSVRGGCTANINCYLDLKIHAIHVVNPTSASQYELAHEGNPTTADEYQDKEYDRHVLPGAADSHKVREVEVISPTHKGQDKDKQNEDHVLPRENSVKNGRQGKRTFFSRIRRFSTSAKRRPKEGLGSLDPLESDPDFDMISADEAKTSRKDAHLHEHEWVYV
jgi:hypothetical protein